MLESFLRYLRFLSKSTNQHGVHSPFVYSYLTEGIYNTKRSYKGYQKKRRLLQATIDYFQVKNILGTPEFQIDPNKEKANQFGKEAYIKLHYIKAIETFTKEELDRKSTRLNSSHVAISYAVFCLKKKKNSTTRLRPTQTLLWSLGLTRI